ncbi:MAG: C39 family peptidase [Pseudomonadota bacterium]
MQRLLIVLCVLLTACSAHRAGILEVTSYQQTTDYTCGPSSVRSLLGYWGKNETEEHLAQQVQASEEWGTAPEPIVEYLKQQGFDVTWGTDGTLALLRKNIAEKVPVLVEWIDWGGHWVLVIGYDDRGTPAEDDDELVFADPYDAIDGKQDGYTRFNAQRFDSMWFDALYFKRGEGLTNRVWIRAVPRSALAQ